MPRTRVRRVSALTVVLSITVAAVLREPGSLPRGVTGLETAIGQPWQPAQSESS